MHTKLSAIGRTVNNDEYVSTLIGSLPECYTDSINSLINSCDATNTNLTPVAVNQAATQEYERHTLLKEINATQEEAFATAYPKSKKKNIEYFNCKKRGHYKSGCWAKGSRNERGGPKKDGKKSKAKDGKSKDAANAAKNSGSSESEEESWAVMDDTDGSMAIIVEIDDASSEGESQDQQSVLAVSTLTGSEAELYDSGASRHMSPFSHHFTNLCSIPPRPVTAANNHNFYATGMGDLQIDVPNGSKLTHIILKDTLYAPDMTLTVISISKIASTGYSVIFEGKYCKIKNKTGTIIGKIEARPNGLYQVDCPIVSAAATHKNKSTFS